MHTIAKALYRTAILSAALLASGCTYREYREETKVPPPPPAIAVVPAPEAPDGDHHYDMVGRDGRRYGTVEFRAVGIEGHVYDNSGRLIGDIVSPDR